MDNNLINASYDLGEAKMETFRHVIFPLWWMVCEVKFSRSLSQQASCMTRFDGGNRVIARWETAIEPPNQQLRHGSAIGVILILSYSSM